MVKRPIGVQVSYLDERGDEVEKKLYDFSARVFLHEMDHVLGRSMMHWSLSEGNIDIIKTHLDESENLATTVEFYKEKI